VAILALGKVLVAPRRHGGRPSPLLPTAFAAPPFLLRAPALLSPDGAVANASAAAPSSSSSLSPSPPSSSFLSAKVAAPHVARFLLVLRLALTTEAQQRAHAAYVATAAGAPTSAVDAAQKSALVAPATPETV
jgi:hypothetical protein